MSVAPSETPVIEIHDIGPVYEFSYRLSDFGLHILRGAQGVGKTTILRTVQLATDGRTDQVPTKRDGAKKGEATVAGRTVRISRNVREEGELTVDGLGDLDLTVLHSPKFVDAATRDRYRIKALVRLSGVQADASLFYDLVGGQEGFDEIVDSSATDTDDLVDMAAKIKRSLDKAALVAEASLETANANVRAKMDACLGIDFSMEHNSEKLAAALQAAVAEHAALKQQRADALDAQEQALEASKRREQIAKSYSGPTIELARQQQKDVEAAVASSSASIRVCEQQLANAKAVWLVVQERKRSADLQVVAAEAHDKTILAIESAIDQVISVECPTDDAVLAAGLDVDLATQAVQSGVRIRDAMKARADADQYKIEVKDMAETAKNLRKAAAQTFDVLSDAIAKIPQCPMSVWNNEEGAIRLVIDTERDDREPFDELSDGERWKVIVPMCFARNRLIVLPQAAYGELQPANRTLLNQLAREHEAYILTAQADDGELRGEAYNGKTS